MVKAKKTLMREPDADELRKVLLGVGLLGVGLLAAAAVGFAVVRKRELRDEPEDFYATLGIGA